AELSEKYGKTIIHLPPEREFETTVFAPDPKLTINMLFASAWEALNRVPKVEILPEVKVRKIINIDEMLTSLTERIAGAMRLSFRDWQKSVVGEDREAVKSNMIVSFLAMLELVRQGMMDALQNTEFEDIELIGITSESKNFDSVTAPE
ncbi:MAG: hypothetical protein KA052_01120, partial [Candidatus Pacebacteria bacterium]|nr:hypothetical protein [Candidatus Paceibacterota bacterium]